MLLLYILWDDWSIFIISSSIEQLQQQLEYNQLNPDFHSWWISKMQSDTLEKRYAKKLFFKTAFRPSCMNRALVFEWHKRLKEGRESVRNDERCRRSKKVNTPKLVGQRVRVRVTMLRFSGSSGKDSQGRGQHSANQASVISTRTIHQSTTPSLTQTIWPRWASR